MNPVYQKVVSAILQEHLRMLSLNFKCMLKRSKSCWRAASPSDFAFLAALPPKISHKNLGISILLKIMKNSNNCSSRDDLTPTAFRGNI